MKKSQSFDIKKLAVISMLSALSFVLFLFEIPVIPGVPHLKLDFSDIPALFASIAYGPIIGIAVEFVKNLLELIFKGFGTQMGFGNIMNFIVGCAYIVPFSIIYRKFRNLKGIILSIIISCFSIVIIGMGANYLVTPLFFKAFLKIDLDSATLLSAVWGATLINVIKGFMLSVLSVPLIKVILERLKRFFEK